MSESYVPTVVRVAASARETNQPTAADNPPPSFCEKKCQKYCCGCFWSVILGLLVALGLTIAVYYFGLLVAAFVPGVVILCLTRYYYHDHITKGQMIVSFFETVLWMIPLLIWDLLWLLLIAPQLRSDGLCGLCILAYLIQFYFFAGFCEEFIKYLTILRISKSVLTDDWRAMLAYGICSGCGFGTTENILYVLSSGYPTAVVRAFVSVPLHCLTGAIIGMSLARQRSQAPKDFCSKLVYTVFIPWAVHGTFDFLLTIGQNMSSYGLLLFLAALAVFIAGLVYARYESTEMAKDFPDKVNIFQKINEADPPILGQRGISQMSHDPQYVCDCFYICMCCCPSLPPTDNGAIGPHNVRLLSTTHSPAGRNSFNNDDADF